MANRVRGNVYSSQIQEHSDFLNTKSFLEQTRAIMRQLIMEQLSSKPNRRQKIHRFSAFHASLSLFSPNIS